MGLRLGRLYFGVQALAVVLWWLLLVGRPDLRASFRVASAPDSTLLAFAPGDLLLVALGSALVAWRAGPARAWPRPLAWAVAGSVAYATLYVLTLALAAAASSLGAALMTPAAIGCALAARALDHVEPALPPGLAR